MILIYIKKYEGIRIFLFSVLVEGKGANMYEMFVVMINRGFF